MVEWHLVALSPDLVCTVVVADLAVDIVEDPRVDIPILMDSFLKEMVYAQILPQ